MFAISLQFCHSSMWQLCSPCASIRTIADLCAFCPAVYKNNFLSIPVDFELVSFLVSDNSRFSGKYCTAAQIAVEQMFPVRNVGNTERPDFSIFTIFDPIPSLLAHLFLSSFPSRNRNLPWTKSTITIRNNFQPFLQPQSQQSVFTHDTV